MSTPRLSLLPVIILVLGAITLSEGLRMAKGRKKCCYSADFATIPPKRQVVSYIKTSQLCSNSALLLTTAGGKKVCARPSDAWVQKTIKFLDQKKKKSLGDQTTLQ